MAFHINFATHTHIGEMERERDPSDNEIVSLVVVVVAAAVVVAIVSFLKNKLLTFSVMVQCKILTFFMEIVVNFKLRSCSFTLSPHKFYEYGARPIVCVHYVRSRSLQLYYFRAHHIFSKHSTVYTVQHLT